MSSTALLQPVAAMLLLTLVVWVLLFVRRLGFMTKEGIDAQSVATPEQMAAISPPGPAAVANNFKNLFEVPVVFYAVVMVISLAGISDQVHVYCAWAFVALRAAHSLIHCTYNTVMHRFVVYLLSSIAVWVMVVRSALQLF